MSLSLYERQIACLMPLGMIHSRWSLIVFILTENKYCLFSSSSSHQSQISDQFKQHYFRKLRKGLIKSFHLSPRSVSRKSASVKEYMLLQTLSRLSAQETLSSSTVSSALPSASENALPSTPGQSLAILRAGPGLHHVTDLQKNSLRRTPYHAKADILSQGILDYRSLPLLSFFPTQVKEHV